MALIAERIRLAIIDGSFAAGEKLREVPLAAALRVSRGPVREALQRLIQEGLLRSEPNRGVFVVSLDENDLRDVYYARTLLERAAIIRLMERTERADLEELARCVDEMRLAGGEGDAAGVARWDLRFHQALVEAARSTRLKRMFDTLIVETGLAIAGGSAAPRLELAVVEEHVALLEAVLAGDRPGALALLEDHMEVGIRRRLTGRHDAEATARVATGATTDD